MGYYRTQTGGMTAINTIGSSPQIGSHKQSEQSEYTVKVQEVRNLVKHYSGKKVDWKDDKFILTGIKNILNGRF